MTPTEPPPDIGRLRWQCRRGMLELDLLLMDFLEHRYGALPEAWQRDFERLLEYPDPILRDWLLGRNVPQDPELQRLVELIRTPAGGP